MSSPPLNLERAAQSPIVSHNQNRLALFWLTTAVGAVLFVALQSFSYVNDYVKVHGTAPVITFEVGALWMFSAFYCAWIVTVLLALIGSVRSQWAALTLGSIMVTLNSFAGAFDGLRDGGHIIFSALFLITLPGVCATIANWRQLKQEGARHVVE